ncbi:heterokaryon incompatibility protein-domain-containing protein [Xylariaceae sp. FL0016]|nr:heterokaryon incompatibility protein-domain-containing protein [Xylariaceae sp. FL0016]
MSTRPRWPDEPQDGQIGDIQLLGEDAMQLRGSSAFYGRKLEPKLDLRLVNDWLELCEREHGARCEDPGESFDRDPRDLLVVDVERLCVARLPPTAKFMALSYCWPSSRTLQTNSGNLDILQEPGSLRDRMSELPVVIQDTIKFVYQLGYQYLWVDSLCIIQDHEEQKKAQIGQMDRIYSSAHMTIVPVIGSLDPDKACMGLPRFNPSIKCREQKIVTVQGRQLAVPFEAVDGLIHHRARWGTRAWTFQEHLLSQRILFLTESQAYFQCRCNVFCEDCHGEIDTTYTRIEYKTSIGDPGLQVTLKGILYFSFDP